MSISFSDGLSDIERVPSRSLLDSYMTVQQGMGMQQNSQSVPQQSQSRHFVFPGAVPAGLIMDTSDAVGLIALTGDSRVLD